MKITNVSVRNYRSLKNVDVAIDDYTAFVGANGSGKSSLLYALDWFFNGTALSLSDFSDYKEGETDPESCEIEVAVTFGELSARDKERLKQYGRGASAHFRRTWSANQVKDKVVGNALQGPGFAEVRQFTKVGDFRPAYKALRVALTELPDLGASPSREEVHAALAEWESDDAHVASLTAIDNDDANHMFGINGSNVIKECVQLVIIPAATDITSQVGVTGSGSTLGKLIGAFMTNAGSAARAQWLEDNSDKVADLNRMVKEGVEASTTLQAGRINARLASFVPNTSLQFRPEVPEWAPRNDATVSTDITINGITNDVSRQGHGIQRAVMIAMFESLVPDADLMTGTHEQQEEESEQEADARLATELANLPTIIVCIEEPEIYQHPIRARSFARILAELSAQDQAQVLLATHSPYFVRPSQFSSLRRFSLDSTGGTMVVSTTTAGVAIAAACPETQVSKIVDKRLPTAFSEGFFGDAVIAVEGDTDRAVIEALAEKMSLPLDDKGISVLDMSGKEGLRIPFELLHLLKIPTFVVVDADCGGGPRKHPADSAKAATATASHRASTQKVVDWLHSPSVVHEGSSPYVFGAPTVITDKFVIWKEDVEEELLNWPSFMTALTSNGGALRSSKDLLAYRTAVIDADLADIPSTLRRAVETMASFVRS